MLIERPAQPFVTEVDMGIWAQDMGVVRCLRWRSRVMWRRHSAERRKARANSRQLGSRRGGEGGPEHVEIGGWPIEGESITSGPSDGGDGFLRTAQLYPPSLAGLPSLGWAALRRSLGTNLRYPKAECR